MLFYYYIENDTTITTIESQYKKQLNIILDKLKFNKYIARYDTRDLIYLYKETKGEPKVSDIVERASYTLKDIANKVQIYLSSSISQIQTILNIREQGIEAGEINTLDLASISKYIAIQKKITIYTIRLQQIQIGDILVGLGQQALYTLTIEQVEAIISLIRAYNTKEIRALVITLVLVLLTQLLKESDQTNLILSIYTIFAFIKDSSQKEPRRFSLEAYTAYIIKIALYIILAKSVKDVGQVDK